MKKLLLSCLTVFALVALGVSAARAAEARSPEAALQTAAQLFADGEYSLAARTYQKVADQGYADAGLYHNLGVVYYRAGDLGRGLWALRMAQQAAPRDAGILAALAMLRGEVAAQTLPEALAEPGLFEQIATTSGAWLTVDELATVTLVLWWGVALLALVVMFGRTGASMQRLARYAATVSALLLVVAAVALASRMRIHQQFSAAVVVAQEMTVSSGPGANYPAQLTLPSGVEVDVVGRSGEWVQLALDGRPGAGWAPAAAVAEVASVSDGS